MTEYYAAPPRRTQVHPSRPVEYVGHANLDGYRETMAWVRSRAATVRWEDIDPDFDPTIPPKPTFSYEANESLDEGLFFFDGKPYVEYIRAMQAMPPMPYEELEAQPAEPKIKAPKPKIFQLTQDNYDRLERISSQIQVVDSQRITWDACWMLYHSNIYLKIGRKEHRVSPAFGMWLLEYGEPMPSTFQLKRRCGTSYCCKPAHHSEDLP